MSTTDHMARLALANEVRGQRAELKRQIRTGETTTADVLRQECPDWLRTMSVEKLILITPRRQGRTLQRILHAAGIGAAATFGGISNRQREILLAGLAEADKRYAERRKYHGKNRQPRGAVA